MTIEAGGLLVIEGTDGAGKTLQTELLRRKLESKGVVVGTFDFPRYETAETGALVGRMLRGEFGDPMKIDPHLTVLPYILDEVLGSQEIEEWVAKGGVALSNRYFTSNVHQIAKMEGEDQDRFRDWLWHFGYDVMGIRRPDLVVVLLAEPIVCRENIMKKAVRKYTGGQAMDMVERDFQHQMRAAAEYRRTIANDANWVGIESSRDGEMIDPEVIHQLVWTEVERRRRRVGMSGTDQWSRQRAS